MDISLIKPYSKNAKKHPEKQVRLIAESIKRFGFDSPIIIDKNNEIIAGHGRYEASKLLGLSDVPVIQKESLTDDEVKAYRLADNKIAESEWDMDLVAEELRSLTDELIDLSGFSKDILDLEYSFKNTEIDIEKVGEDAKEYKPKVCPNCNYEF